MTRCSAQGPGWRRSHTASQICDRWIVSRVDRAREQNDVTIRAWVHPQRGSGEACVAEAADGKDHASRAGIGGVNIPAEATQVLSPDRRIVRSEQRIIGVWCLRDGFLGGVVGCLDLLSGMSGLLRSCHQLQRRLRQRELARAAREPIKQGLRIEAEVVRRREHTGMPSYSPHAARRRVEHNAPKQGIEIGILARIVFAFVVMCRRCDARQQTGAPHTGRTSARHAPYWRRRPGNRSSTHHMWATCFGRGKIAGFFHAKRPKYVFLNVNVFWLAGHFLDQRAKQNEVDVSVVEKLTGG